jgi:membrane protein required for colicin V production
LSSMELESLNNLDIVIFMIITLSTVFGFMRGFIGSLLSLIGWFLTFYCTYYFFPEIKPYLEERIDSAVAVVIAGHIGLFVGFIVFFGVLNLFIQAIASGIKLLIPDRFLGMLFGFMRGVLLIVVAYALYSYSLEVISGGTQDREKHNAPKVLARSQSYDYLKVSKKLLVQMIPYEYRISFDQNVEDVYTNLLNKDRNERFRDYMVGRLMRKLSSEERQAIEEFKSEHMMTTPEAKIELEVMKKILAEYERRDLKDIPDEDLQRFKRIIKAKQANIEG